MVTEEEAKNGNNYIIMWNILFMAPIIKLIVILNVLWRKCVGTNERCFDLLLQILITHCLSVTCPPHLHPDPSAGIWVKS